MGLLSCCSNYFRDTFPVLGYRGWLTVFAVTSTIIANAGLTAILKFSVPVLVAIYPLALVLIILTFLPDVLRKASEADARDAARRAQADKPGDAPDAKNSGENMEK